MIQRIRTSITTLPLALALGLVGQAHAQEVSTPQVNKSGPLEEVTVTANRREEKINDIGMAIQAFSGDALDQFAVSNVADLQNIVPSFNVTQGYQGVPVYTLRGVGFNAINFSATSTVGTYVDEGAYAYPIMNTGPIFDVERVEVLKGPQGTLYGRNTTGGLIDVITNKPTKSFQSMVSADVGNFETLNAEGFVSGPLFGDWIQGRIAVRAESSGRGFQESVTSGERLGEKEKYGVRASLALQPTDSTNIDFSANYFLNKSDTLAGQAVAFVPTADPAVAAGGSGLAPFAGTNDPRLCNLDAMGNCLSFGGRQPDDARDADFVPRAVREQQRGTSPGFGGRLQEDNPFVGLKLRVAQDITDDVRLVSLTNYNRFERDGLVDAGGAIPEIFVNRVTGTINSFSEDLHLEGKTASGITWLAGAYYANDRIIDVTRSNVFNNTPVNTLRAIATAVEATDLIPLDPMNPTGPSLVSTLPFSRGTQFPVGAFHAGSNLSGADIPNAFREFQDGGTLQTETYSFFANGDAPLTDSLKLTLGARFTNDVQDFAGCSRDSFGNILPTEQFANRFLFADAAGPFNGQIATAPAQGDCVTFDTRTNTFGIVTSRLDEDNVSWRTGLDWKATDDVLVYTSISRGFKAGTTPLNASNSAQQNAPVTQEKLTAYEIGTKARLFDRRIQANVAGFFYDYKDKQINTFFQDPIFAVLARLDNVDESEIYGIDADVTIQATDSLSFNLNVLGVASEVTKYLGTDQFGRTIDFSGSEIPATPKWLVSATTFYQTELASWDVSAALNARFQKRSSTILEAPPVAGFRESNFDIPGFGLVNGSIGVTSPDGTLSFSLFGRNLLDKYYFQSIITNASTIVRYAGEPRTFGLTTTKRF